MKTLFTALIFVASSAIFGQNWTGNVDADWNNSANWSSWPLNGASIVIDPTNYTGNAASPIIGSNSVFTPNDITIQNGAVVTVQADLSVSNNLNLTGSFVNVVMQSGTISVGNSMSIDLGAITNINGATLNVSNNLTIKNGNTSQSSECNLISGSVSLGNNLQVQNNLGSYSPAFFMDGGSFSVDSIVWNGSNPGNGTPLVRFLSGNATINGDIINTTGSTVNMYFLITGVANVQFNGSLIQPIQLTDTIEQIGASVFSINTPTTWNNAGVFYGYFSSITFNNSTILQGTGVYDFHGVVISNSFTLNHLSPNNIFVKGNMTNNGTFNANNNHVHLTGTTAQQISGTSATHFYDLTVNHSSTGVTLNSDLQVDNSLTLTNGKIVSSSTNLITLIDNATATSGNDSSFVEGPFKKIGNDAFVFPIGKDTLWRRLAITAPTNINSEFIAEYFNTAFSSLSPVSFPISNVSNKEYWTINKLNTTDNIQLTLYWEDAAYSSINNCSILSIAEWENTIWNNVSSTAVGSCVANNSGNIQSNNTVGNESIYTFAWLGNSSTNNVSICMGDSITVGTSTYGNAGTYTDTLTNSNNTDSLVITNLNVIQPVDTTINRVACEGDTIYIAGKIYYQTGTYFDTITSFVTNCDSAMTINLTIVTIDTSVIVQNDTLFSNQTGATYQWINCNQYTPISGETNNYFVPTVSGSYAVVVSKGNCADTSNCHEITITNIAENNALENIKIYPNPFNNQLFINTNKATGNIQIFNLLGEVVIFEKVNSSTTTINADKLSKGTYIYKFTDERNNTKIGKLIKQ